MHHRRLQALAASGLIFLALSLPATAEESRFDLGLRLNLLGGSGDPTNDVLGGGLFGHYELNERWSLGFSLDYSDEFDIERSPASLGLVQDPSAEVVDSKASFIGGKIWIERVYRREGRTEWFWGVGVGADSIDVNPATGPLADGGTFDITIDAGTDLIVLGTAGLRLKVGQRGAFEFALRADQHFADWKVIDRVSGAMANVSNYTLTGAHIGWIYRF